MQRQESGMERPAVVALVRTADRADGVRRALRCLGVNPVAGRDVLLKPNGNTADPFPASTHVGTLEALIGELRAMGAGEITLGERSGPADTGEVLRETGMEALALRLGVGVCNFDDLPDGDWVRVDPPGSHWRRGFDVPRRLLEAPCVVTTCCCKTHRFGGVFTMSLKLSVGFVHRRQMKELHASFRSMRRMIAEVNAVYRPALVLMDALEVFTDGGPMTGERRRAGVMIAGTDRVAVDAVGLALLKDLGSTRRIMSTPVFAQQQIVRAVELGLGAGRPEDIRIVGDDGASEEYAARLSEILEAG